MLQLFEVFAAKMRKYFNKPQKNDFTNISQVQYKRLMYQKILILQRYNVIINLSQSSVVPSFCVTFL